MKAVARLLNLIKTSCTNVLFSLSLKIKHLILSFSCLHFEAATSFQLEGRKETGKDP